MSKDYGERWRMGLLSAINRHGCPIDASEHARAVACVNALAGIPTESLPEVKKAWLAANVMRFIGVDMNGGYIRVGYQHEPVDSFFIDDIVNLAKKLRSRGADFGELNALLDSVKD